MQPKHLRKSAFVHYLIPRLFHVYAMNKQGMCVGGGCPVASRVVDESCSLPFGAMTTRAWRRPLVHGQKLSRVMAYFGFHVFSVCLLMWLVAACLQRRRRREGEACFTDLFLSLFTRVFVLVTDTFSLSWRVYVVGWLFTVMVIIYY